MDFGINQGLVEELYLRFRENPSSVDGAWQKYFERLSEAERAGLLQRGEPAAGARYNGHGANGHTNGSNGHAVSANGSNGRVREISSIGEVALDNDLQQDYQERVTALVNGYRLRGHRFARLDPLGLAKIDDTELSLARFGLDQVDPNTMFATGNFAGPTKLPLKEFVRRLQETYCRTIGVEYRNIEEPEIRSWLQERMESTGNRIQLSYDEQVEILSKLIDAEIFEQFLHTKYVGAKRFSLEGTESIIPMLELIVKGCRQHRVEEIVIGDGAPRAPERARERHGEGPARDLRRVRRRSSRAARSAAATSSTTSATRPIASTPDGHPIHLTLAFNPSHLEFVNPVVEGRVRAKQDRRGDTERRGVLPLADPRRRGVHRPGRRGRDTQPLGPARLHRPAERCTWWSTIRSASPPSGKTRAPRATAPISRACCAAQCST